MMDNFRFLHTSYLWFGIPLVLLILMTRIMLLRRYSRMTMESKYLRTWMPALQINRTILKNVLRMMGLLFLLIALVRPQGNPRPEIRFYEGRDIVFLVDVSRSMLATDVSPDRLGKVKFIIRDFLQRLEGNRVSLIVFLRSFGDESTADNRLIILFGMFWIVFLLRI